MKSELSYDRTSLAKFCNSSILTSSLADDNDYTRFCAFLVEKSSTQPKHGFSEKKEKGSKSKRKRDLKKGFYSGIIRAEGRANSPEPERNVWTSPREIHLFATPVVPVRICRRIRARDRYRREASPREICRSACRMWSCQTIHSDVCERGSKPFPILILFKRDWWHFGKFQPDHSYSISSAV